MAKLYILSGKNKDRVFELHEDRITVGRTFDNMICLPDDLVSIYHATFIREGDDYRLRDLNSTNTTKINGVKILDSKLNDGDQICFGDVQLRYAVGFRPKIETPPSVPTAQIEPSVMPPAGKLISKTNLLPWILLGMGTVIVLMLVVIVFLGINLLQQQRMMAQLLARKPETPVEVVVPPPPAQPPVAVATPTEPMTVKSDSEMSEMSSKAMEPMSPEAAPPVETVAPPPVVSSVTTNEVKPILPSPAEVQSEPKVTKRPAEKKTETAPPVPSGPVIVKPNPYDNQGAMLGQTPIDQLVFSQLQRLKIQPAALCSDPVFVRRVYLDVIGTIPTAEEVKAFLDDRNPNKRAVLIDKLLDREEFGDYWAMKWCDLLRVKSEFPINLWPNAVQTYHQWVRTCLKENRPYDRFVRNLLTSSGSNFREPPVNFYRAVRSKDPQSLAQAVALTFMGTRAEDWPKEKLDGMAMFFSQVGYKATAEWKEEIVYFDASKATNGVMKATFPDGTSVDLPVAKDPRVIFANWLISPSNPWFTRNIVNRVWSWLLGRGVIHEPDDIRSDNPPVIPELLTLLERELIANKYNLKSVYRMILKSQTYQLSCVPRSNDPRAEAYFAFYPARRLEAEVMIDAINQITGTTEKYSSPIPEPFTFIPENERSIVLADGSISSPFLELFGRSSRTTGLEVERNNRPTASQQLHLLNSSHIQRKIEQSAKLRELFQQNKGKPHGAADALYLTILSRYPMEEELKTIAAYSRAGVWSQRTGWDVAWALINSAEFQERH